MSESKPVTTRRHVLAAAGATIALQTGRALGQQQLGPPPHAKGPLVFLNYDQIELDAAYTQNVYEPTIAQVRARLTSNSEAVRKRIGQPHSFLFTAAPGGRVLQATTHTSRSCLSTLARTARFRISRGYRTPTTDL